MTNATAIIPQEIKNWVGSEGVFEEVVSLNEKLNIKGDDQRFIPYLVFQLITKNLKPQDFVSALSDWLEIGPTAASTLAKEIQEKILDPIKKPLYDWGVDINLIKSISVTPVTHAPQPPTITESKISPITVQPSQKNVAPAPVGSRGHSNIIIPAPVPRIEEGFARGRGDTPVGPSGALRNTFKMPEAPQEPMDENAPVMLHKEKGMSSVTAGKEYTPQREEAYEGGGGFNKIPKATNIPRVVHYSENRTPLTTPVPPPKTAPAPSSPTLQTPKTPAHPPIKSVPDIKPTSWEQRQSNVPMPNIVPPKPTATIKPAPPKPPTPPPFTTKPPVVPKISSFPKPGTPPSPVKQPARPAQSPKTSFFPKSEIPSPPIGRPAMPSAPPKPSLNIKRSTESSKEVEADGNTLDLRKKFNSNENYNHDR